MNVSIIIRSFNEEKFIGNCIRAIRSQQVGFDYEVILVDSCSEDRTVEIARSYGARIIKINRSEFSYGRALNLGIVLASNPVIVSISAHCIPVSNQWLEMLVLPLLNGMAEMTFGSHVAGAEARTSEKNYFKLKYSIPPGFCYKPLLNNGNSAFLKRLWTKRSFNEVLPAQEDVEFCKWHANNSNAKLVFVEKALVTHFHNDRNFNLYNRLFKELFVEFNLGEKTIFNFFLFFFTFPVVLIGDFLTAFKAGNLISAATGIVTFRAVHIFAYIKAATYFSIFGRGNRERWKL